VAQKSVSVWLIFLLPEWFKNSLPSGSLFH
jgi:hypothetical protein